MDNEILSQGYCGLGIKFTAHLRLVLTLQMSGATPLLPPARLLGVDSDHHLSISFSVFTYLNSEPTNNLIRSHVLLAGHVILSIKTYNRNTV